MTGVPRRFIDRHYKSRIVRLNAPKKGDIMDREWLYISERINEVSRICNREHPIYEQVSNFSIALYVLGVLKCPDILSAEEIDDVEAAAILKEHFVPIQREDVPSNYNILKSEERYLLVIGDPAFPAHFAVVTDMHSLQPFFSKLELYGSGFDSMAELESEFLGKQGIGYDDFTFYKMRQPNTLKKGNPAKIYTIRDDGKYSVWEYQSEKQLKKEATQCR